MDSQQTPRGSEEPIAPRGSPMVKQNPQLPPDNQARGPAASLSPRYPINSESTGGGRPGQPQTLHRLDSRSSLVPGQQNPFPRPLGPRPANPLQGRPVNPQAVGPGRFAGSPGVRPPPGGFPGGRPVGYGPNQQPQIYYQPRNGEVRPQRPINLSDSVGPVPIRPQVGEHRQLAPGLVPETIITPATRNDSALRAEERLNGQPIPNRSQPIPSDRQRHQPRERMEIVDSRTPTPSGGPSTQQETLKNELKDNENGIPKRGASPRTENEDDDDADVVVDKENSVKKSLTPSPLPDRPPSALKPEEDRPESRTSSHKMAASPTPSERPSRPSSKISNHELAASSLSPSPIPADNKSGNSSRAESRQGESPVPEIKSPEPSEATPNSHGEDQSKEKIISENEKKEEEKEDDETRASSVASSRSPVPPPPRTPEGAGNLSVPLSASPKSPKSPVGSVKGFDNGQPRSLSPKAPSPGSPGSAKSVDEKKRATFAEDDTANKEKSVELDRPMTPGNETARKPTTPTTNEQEHTPGTTPEGRKSLPMKRSTSGRSIKSDAGSESGTNQSNAVTPTTNGVAVSPTKKMPSKTKESNDKRSTAGSPVKSPSKSVKSLPRTPEAGPPSTAEKKVPMNKIQVGAAPSPNLKTVRSKIGSLENASYKPGGGKVKIENRKLDFSNAQPKIAAKNDKYMPSGGDKKITQVKLQWNAKSKVGSLDNATYKPGGGDKKIETVKLDFKDKAKPKVGSKDNAKHVPGGGTFKSSSTPPKTPQEQPNHVETQKIEIKAESKIGSLDNVKHKPGGGDKKIFNDKDYLRQTGSNLESHNGSGAQMVSSSVAKRPNYIEIAPSPPEPNPPPTTPTRSRRVSAMSPLTPRALRKSLQVKTPESPGKKRVTIAEEEDRKDGNATPLSSRKSPDGQETPRSSRKSSPKAGLLPKLASTPESSPNQAPTERQRSNTKLPKLVETSSLSSRVELTQ